MNFFEYLYKKEGIFHYVLFYVRKNDIFLSRYCSYGRRTLRIHFTKVRYPSTFAFPVRNYNCNFSGLEKVVIPITSNFFSCMITLLRVFMNIMVEHLFAASRPAIRVTKLLLFFRKHLAIFCFHVHSATIFQNKRSLILVWIYFRLNNHMTKLFHRYASFRDVINVSKKFNMLFSQRCYSQMKREYQITRDAAGIKDVSSTQTRNLYSNSN